MNFSFTTRRKLCRIIGKVEGKWYAAVEQAMLSALNLLFSVTTVYFAGVDKLGVYSFVFVLTQLLAGIAASLVIRQMLLTVSGSSVSEQIRLFAATFRIIAIGIGMQWSVVLLSYLIVSPEIQVQYWPLFLGSALYAGALSLAELFRQYLYIKSKQRISFIYTSIACLVSSVCLLIAILIFDHELLYQYTFFCLFIGLALSVLINTHCLSHLRISNRYAKKRVLPVFKRYAEKGKTATYGSLVTWTQNQSVTPLLMALMGPTTVGYYNIARMCFMPVNVINMGLCKSALPKNNSLYKQSGITALSSSITKHSRTSMVIASAYLLAVMAIYLAGTYLFNYSQNQTIIVYLLPTAIVTLLSIYRSWISQHFVARMQFTTLLWTGAIAAIITLLSMFTTGYFLNSVVLVILSSALGELYLIHKLNGYIKTTYE